MSVAKEILAFSEGREPWQRDALRRLFTQIDFSAADLAEVVAMVKATRGLVEGAAPTPQPLTDAHIPDRGDDAVPVVLNSIEDVLNANRLATGQKLPFGIKGLTVLYGDNGSGKSGYCRILKKVCRVRQGGEEDIRGNAFDPQSGATPAEATLRFTVGSEPISEIRWKSGQVALQALSRVSVFDAKTATLYADQQNRIEFLPHGLDVLMRLGEVCERIERVIDSEKSKIERALAIPLPALPEGTFSHSLLSKLTATTVPQDIPTEEAIAAACTWTEADAQELEATERHLHSDPLELANKCRLLGQTVARLETDLTTAVALLDDKAIAEIKQATEHADVARAAATAAAKAASGAVPLPGFGSEPWRLLFTYARQYSALAYPGQSFPVTGGDAKCVLCQQPLGAEATERFKIFDKFVQGAAEAYAADGEKTRDTKRDALEGLALRSAMDATTMLAGLTDENSDGGNITSLVGAFFDALGTRKKAVLAAIGGASWSDIPALPASPVGDLGKARAHLTEREANHTANQDPAAREQLETKRTELRARKTLSENSTAVLQRRRDLDTLSRLAACRAACKTTAISRKNSELRKQYVTKEFEERLFAEIAELDLSYLRFKVQEKSDHVASFVGVGLETAVKVKNHDVLSDGEFRALAMACFLTEVNSIAGHSGIIIDDPVSSLDHLRTRIVAARLVREAVLRQVIVFTHDLLFYHELCEAAAEQNVPVVRHWIRRSEEQGFGTISQNEEPWQAKKVAQRVDALNQKLAKIRRMNVTSGDAYRVAARDFYSDLRETWERLVEELLINGSVTRFQLGVQTQSLKGAQVTDEDYKRVFFAMKRASTFSGHDRAQGAQLSSPRADEMLKDIENLKSYADELGKRKAKLEKLRRELEKPEVGTTV